MYLTRYGTQFGQRTVRHGRTIYVAASAQYSGIVSNITGAGGTTGTFAASDNNDGLSPERAVRTVNYAVNTLAQTGDTVILLPGTHTVATTVAPRAGVAILGSGKGEEVGLGYPGESILTSTGTNIHLLNIATDNVEIGYLTLRPTTQYSAVVFGTGSTSITTSGLGIKPYLHHCYFDLITPTVHLDTCGIDFTARGTSMTTKGAQKAGTTLLSGLSTAYAFIEHCVFASGGAQGAGIWLATVWAHVRNCRFFNTQGTWATPFLVATDTDNSVAENLIFTTSGAIGNCMEGTDLNTLNGLAIINCRFPPTGQARAFGGFGNTTANGNGGSANFTECYVANSGTAVVTG